VSFANIFTYMPGCVIVFIANIFTDMPGFVTVSFANMFTDLPESANVYQLLIYLLTCQKSFLF
jgi:hypothetical protein